MMLITIVTQSNVFTTAVATSPKIFGDIIRRFGYVPKWGYRGTSPTTDPPSVGAIPSHQ